MGKWAACPQLFDNCQRGGGRAGNHDRGAEQGNGQYLSLGEGCHEGDQVLDEHEGRDSNDQDGDDQPADERDNAAKIAPDDVEFQLGASGKGDEGEGQFVEEQELWNIFGMDKIEDKRAGGDPGK